MGYVIYYFFLSKKNQEKGKSLYPVDHAANYSKRIPLKEQGNVQVDGREYF